MDGLRNELARASMDRIKSEQSTALNRSPGLSEHLLQAHRLDCSLRRFYVDEFFTHYASSFRPGSCVLDLGGQKQPKRGLFDIERYDYRVCYVNLTTAKQPDVQADAGVLPFKNESFDAVICAEMLEHVPHPLTVVSEARRVLRPQGILLISAPFLFQIHGDPHDYGRYTDHFWCENLEKAGFRDIIVEKQGFFWSVVTDMMRAWAYECAKQDRPRSVFLQRLVARLVTNGKRTALRWERQIRPSDHAFLSRYTTGFGIHAVRS